MGRDVESMIRDLTESAVDMVRREKQAEVRRQAESNVEEQLLDLLLPQARPHPQETLRRGPGRAPPSSPGPRARSCAASSGRKPRHARGGDRGAREELPGFQILSSQGVEEMDINVKDLAARPLREQDQAPPAEHSRRAGRPGPGRAEPARGRRAGRARGRRTQCRTRASSSSTRSTRSRAARAATAPT